MIYQNLKKSNALKRMTFQLKKEPLTSMRICHLKKKMCIKKHENLLFEKKMCIKKHENLIFEKNVH